MLALAALALGLAAALALGRPRRPGPRLRRLAAREGSRAWRYAGALAVQPDGKIVVAGFGTNGDVAVGRINPDGSDDPAFGGTRLIDFGSFDIGEAVALQPDGKIVVAGRSGARRTGDRPAEPRRLARHGLRHRRQARNRLRGADRRPRRGRRHPAGRKDRAWPASAALDRTIVVTRLEPNGADDTGFGSGGTRRVDFGLGYEEGRALALQPDGKIVVAGFTRGAKGGSN